MTRPSISKTVRLPACRRLNHKKFDISNVRLGGVLSRNKTYGFRRVLDYDFGDGQEPFSLTFPKFITFIQRRKTHYALIKTKHIQEIRKIINAIGDVEGIFTNNVTSPNLNLSFNDVSMLSSKRISVEDNPKIEIFELPEGPSGWTQDVEVILTVYFQKRGQRAVRMIPTAFINFINSPDDPPVTEFIENRKKVV